MNLDAMHLYFAYGSNLSLPQMRKRCPGHQLVGKGCLKDYQLAFDCFSSGWGAGVADVVQHPGSCVWGLVFRLTDADLLSLDQCEGHPRFYRRFQTQVEMESGPLAGVWVYHGAALSSRLSSANSGRAAISSAVS